MQLSLLTREYGAVTPVSCGVKGVVQYQNHDVLYGREQSAFLMCFLRG